MSEKFEGTTPPQESNEEVAREYDPAEMTAIFKEEFLKMHENAIDSTVYDFLNHKHYDENKKMTEKELRTGLIDAYKRNKRINH